ncbi:MAG: hypothetical protein Q8P11_03270 [bacterium]|nr:hypothetical protein [bacterium]
MESQYAILRKKIIKQRQEQWTNREKNSLEQTEEEKALLGENIYWEMIEPQVVTAVKIFLQKR